MKTARFFFVTVPSVVFAYLLCIMSAEAAVVGTPELISVPYGGSSTFTVHWTVTDAPPLGNVTSNSGQFETRGGRGNPPTVLGTVSTSLTKSTTGSTVTFTEMVIVPHNVAIQANRLNEIDFFYRRDFTINGQAQIGRVEIDVVSRSAASFAISRLALSFDNGAPVRVIDRKKPLRANAEITFNGSGMLQAMWEIAGPASTSGTPVFRPLLPVRQYLIGNETQTLESPALPTDSPGLHLLRFRITDPAPGFDTPIIRYFVTDEHTRGQLPAVPMGLVTPPNQSLLAPETIFAWEPIPGTRAYQLEIYAKSVVPEDALPDLGGAIDAAPPVLPLTPPVTGMMVPGTATRTTLSDTVRAHLISGQRYLWRVLAIGPDGDVIGESAVREVRIP